MPYHDFRVLIDWSGNGQFNVNETSRENVTADVISSIRAAAGIDYGQIFPQAKAGRMAFTLRNDHGRYSGYNDDNQLGSGLIQGVILQVWCADFVSGGAYIPIWGGIVDSVEYGTSPSGLDTAEVRCIGNLGAIQDADIDVSVSDTSIADIGTDIAEQIWGNTRIDSTGNATFRYIMRAGNPQFRYYLETSNSPTFGRYVYEGRALRGLRGLAQDTGSRLFEGAEGAVRLYSEAAQTSLAAGAARFTLRHTSTGTNASTYHISAAKPELAQGNIINSVTVNFPVEDIEVIDNARAYGSLQYYAQTTISENWGGGWRANPGDDFLTMQPVSMGGRNEGNAVSVRHITRADPRQPSTLQSVQTFVIEQFRMIAALRLVGESWDDARGAHAIFIVTPGTILTVGTEARITTNLLDETFNWRTEAYGGEASNMELRLTMVSVAGSAHEYELQGELHNVHPAVGSPATTSSNPGIGDLAVYLGSWTVSHGFVPTSTTVTDAASIRKYGTKSYTPSVSFVASETEAQEFARAIINREREAKTRYRVTYILDQKARLMDIPQVSDIVNMEYRGTTRKCWVDSVRHDISKRRHSCELLLTPT